MRTTDFMRMSHAQAAMKASDIAYENEQLRQQLAEANAEIARRLTLDEMNAEIENATKAAADFYETQLAAAQAREQQLREALNLWKLASNNAEESELDDMACYCVPMPLFCDADEATDAAIAIPADTTALSAIVTKAGEVMRERCAEIAQWHKRNHYLIGTEIKAAIRALPGVTMEDIK